MPTNKRQAAKRGDYTDFVRSLQLITIALTKSAVHINRKRYFEEKECEITAAVSSKPVDVRKNHFDLKSKVGVKLTGKAGGPLFELSAEYELHFHGKSPVDRKFVERFAGSDARLIIWPYLREYVNDVSGRMYVPPILLPLSK